MKPVDDNMYELVVLEGLKSKVSSNSNNPPDSFHTRDLFTKHPTLSDAWKSIGRLDDRVTLSSGEKVLPLPMEGTIRQHHLVREAMMFGIGMEIPGLLLFRSEKAAGLTDEDFIAQVWPTVEVANRAAEAFSQIGRDMIVPVADNVEYPRTDKGTAIRSRVYTVFEKEILNAYSIRSDKKLRLSDWQMIAYLQNSLKELLNLDIETDTDLFALGLDSLKAIQLSRLIQRDLDLDIGTDCKPVDQDVIYQQGTVENLSRYLCSRSSSIELPSQDNDLDLMQHLVDTHSTFMGFRSAITSNSSGQHVVSSFLVCRRFDNHATDNS